MKKVGILGGTFDPPHFGHLLIAEEVRIALELDEVWFIPTFEPPHKHDASSSAEDRITMLEKAIAHHSAFKLNLIEMERQGKSYTYDTMKELRSRHPKYQFYFIIGADMVEYLPKWYKVEDLLDLVSFVGVKRHGYRLDSPYPVINVDIPMFDVSSTLIRNRIMNDQTVHFLLPEPVYSYIKEKKLYENRGSKI